MTVHSHHITPHLDARVVKRAFRLQAEGRPCACIVEHAGKEQCVGKLHTAGWQNSRVRERMFAEWLTLKPSTPGPRRNFEVHGACRRHNSTHMLVMGHDPDRHTSEVQRGSLDVVVVLCKRKLGFSDALSSQAYNNLGLARGAKLESKPKEAKLSTTMAVIAAALRSTALGDRSSAV
jgi:hypothetical protein